MIHEDDPGRLERMIPRELYHSDDPPRWLRIAIGVLVGATGGIMVAITSVAICHVEEPDISIKPGGFLATVNPPEWMTITCVNGGHVTISLKDGQVTTDGCGLDDGAQQFWRVIQQMYPQVCGQKRE